MTCKFHLTGMDKRNGCLCKVRRQQSLARGWNWRVLWWIFASEKPRIPSGYRFHLKQPDTRHWFRHCPCIPRPMVTTLYTSLAIFFCSSSLILNIPYILVASSHLVVNHIHGLALKLWHHRKVKPINSYLFFCLTGFDFGYIICTRLPNASYQEEQSFLNNWIDTHIQDAQNVLKKPVLFTEFGKSSKDPCYNTSQRNILFNTMYKKTLSSARRGGAATGGLFWQLLIDGMDNYRDGYEVILKENTSTANMILQQSRKLYQLRRMCARHMSIEKTNIEKMRRARALRIA